MTPPTSLGVLASATLAVALLAASPSPAVSAAARVTATPSGRHARPQHLPGCTWPVGIGAVSADLGMHADRAQLLGGTKTPPSFSCQFEQISHGVMKGFAQLEYTRPIKSDYAGTVRVFLAVYRGKAIPVGQSGGYAVLGGEMTLVMIDKGWEFMMVATPVPKLPGAEKLARAVAAAL